MVVPLRKSGEIASLKIHLRVVKIDDHIFAPDQNQKLKCIDIKSGQVSDSIKLKEGSLIYADGMLYCYSDNGVINLVKLSGTKMEIVGKCKIEKGIKNIFPSSYQ